MENLMATVRPIRWKNDTTGPSHHYDVETLGEITTSVRYQEIEDLGVIEVLDEARLPYTERAEGFGLFDQGGELLTTVQIFAPRSGEDLLLPPGWAFKAGRANLGSGAARETATSAGRS